MRFASPFLFATVPLFALAACAHNPPPAPVSSDVSTTSAMLAAPDSLFETPAEEAAHPTPFVAMPMPSVDAWAGRYPDAASELGQWVMQNPETARALAKWQRRHPEQMESLVEWSTGDLYAPLGAFLMDRAGWSDLQAIAGESDGLHGFLPWVRRAPAAARELVRHTDGLAFADEHAGTLAKMPVAEAELRAHVRAGEKVAAPPSQGEAPRAASGPVD